ncbi:MAG: phosphoribosyltransferase family protein [Actinomycetota bacterium]
MIFADREDAGRRMARALHKYAGGEAVVLAIPRGGVIVGRAVADELGAPLDVVIPRKVGAPGNPELGLGAIAPGVRVLDEGLIRSLGVSDEYLERAIEAEEREIERRSATYRAGRPPIDLRGKTAIVVDDGMATGGTAIAAVRWAKAQGAARVILAVPVAPPAAVSRLHLEADDVVALSTPDAFYAVGQWYGRFDQVSDREVVDAMSEARPA